MQLLILFALAIGASVACHKLIESFFGASLAAALVSSVAFHTIGYLIQGSLDALVLISFVTAFLGSLLVALGIGYVMKRAGTRRQSRRSDESL